MKQKRCRFLFVQMTAALSITTGISSRTMYDFMNDKQIGRLLLCLNTLSELEIKSREQLYRTAEKLQEEIENGGNIELKIQLSQIESAIRTYEEIVEGNYIDNLIRAERERKESLQKKSEQPKQSQTVNRKDRR